MQMPYNSSAHPGLAAWVCMLGCETTPHPTMHERIAPVPRLKGALTPGYARP